MALTLPRGYVVVVRYADDFVVGFERREDAERFRAELTERLATFGLELKCRYTFASSGDTVAPCGVPSSHSALVCRGPAPPVRPDAPGHALEAFGVLEPRYRRVIRAGSCGRARTPPIR